METSLKALAALALFIGAAAAEPFVVDDASIVAAFQKGLGEFTEEKTFPTGEELAKAAKDCPRTTTAPPLSSKAPDDPTRSVFLIGSVYKCGKCDKWHPGGVATAWCLTADGLMVTNHHVLSKAKGAVLGICNREGKTWPITEVIASDPLSDLAIFRVKGSGFTPLPIGKPARPGDRIRVISNPDGRYFVQTFGEVSRYHLRKRRKRESTWMSITADFAKGSSGGPVLNDSGEVVGVVASTNSIYYHSDNGKPEGPLQMVIKDCVPVSALHSMLKADN